MSASCRNQFADQLIQGHMPDRGGCSMTIAQWKTWIGRHHGRIYMAVHGALGVYLLGLVAFFVLPIAFPLYFMTLDASQDVQSETSVSTESEEPLAGVEQIAPELTTEEIRDLLSDAPEKTVTVPDEKFTLTFFIKFVVIPLFLMLFNELLHRTRPVRN